MEQVFFDQPINNETIINSLEFLFPELIVFHWDFMEDCPAELDTNNKKHIFFNTDLYEDIKEFSFLLSIYQTPNKDEEERAFYIAMYFERTMNINI